MQMKMQSLCSSSYLCGVNEKVVYVLVLFA